MLSLAILCRHVALSDPGKPVGCSYPVPSPTALAFDLTGRSRHFLTLHPPILVEESISWLHYGSLALQPADLLVPLVGADQTFAQPTGTFTSGLSADWSPAPPPDITTVATGKVPLTGLTDLHPLGTPTSIAATGYATLIGS